MSKQKQQQYKASRWDVEVRNLLMNDNILLDGNTDVSQVGSLCREGRKTLFDGLFDQSHTRSFGDASERYQDELRTFSIIIKTKTMLK